MDLEALLRGQLRVYPEQPVHLLPWVNGENRIVVQVTASVGEGQGKLLGEYVVFGNNVAEYTIPVVPEKPPTQRVRIPGVDSFMPMGGRK